MGALMFLYYNNICTYVQKCDITYQIHEQCINWEKKKSKLSYETTTVNCMYK